MLHFQTKGETPWDGEMPVLVYLNRIPFWQSRNGRTFPVVAGAEDPPPDDANNEDENESGETFDKDRALATIRKQREREKTLATDLKTLRADLKKFEDKERERSDADKSELEKAHLKLAAAEKAHEESQAKLRRTLIAQAIERAAAKHNARDPEVVAKLIDYEALEVDDDGTPTNAEDLVKTLLKDKPYLVADVADQPTSRNGVPATPRSSGAPKREDKIKENEEKLVATQQYKPIG